MAENMKLTLLLKGIDQLSPIIKKQSPLLKQLDRDATKTYNSLKKLFSLSPKSNFGKQFTSDIRKSNTEANKLKKTLESIAKSPAFRSDTSNTRNIKEEQKELDKLTNSRKKSKTTLERLANLNDRILEPAVQVKNVWKDQINGLRDYTDETKKLYLAQAQFKLINLSPEENKKAFDAVTKSVREMGITTRAEGIEDLTNLHNAFGDLNTAIETLPVASKYRFSMETLFGDQYSSNQIKEQIQNTMKFLELTGKVGKGRAELERWFDTITKISASTGGRITGADFLNMGKTGGVSVQNLNQKGLVNMSTIMQELGGDRTGTSMMSLYQALVGGVMKQSAAERFQYFGLLDESKVEFGKAQKIKRILPGANKLADPMMENPLQAADMLREAMKSKGVNVGDDKAVNKELALLFGNRNAQRLMSILMTQREQVVKEAGLAENAKGNEGMFKIASEDELGKIKKFEKALVEFKTEAGIPLIEVLGKLAQTTTPILKFFGDHPTITQWGLAAIIAGKGLFAITQSASILSGSGLTSFFSKTADATSSASTKVAGFTRELNNATNKTSVFQKIASSPITITLIATGAILAVDTLRQHWDELDERIKKTDENAKSVREQYDNLMGRGLLYNKPGDYKGNEKDFDNLAKQFIETIKEDRTLETNLHPERAGWWEHYKNLTELPYGSYGKTGGQFNPTVAAHRWQQQGLGRAVIDPNVLARVLQQLQHLEDSGRYTKGDVKLITAAIEKMAGKEKINQAQQILNNPIKTDNYNQIAKQIAQVVSPFGQIQQPVNNLTQDFLSLSGQTTPLGETFSGLNTKTDTATGSIKQMTFAAQGFTHTVSNLQIKPPTFSPIPGFGQSNPIFGGGKFYVPPFIGKAKGGSVQKGHTYRINEIGQEFFTPASSGSIVSNDVLRNQRNTASGSPTVNLNVSINIDGNSNNAEQIAQEIRRELTSVVRDLKNELTPDRLARKVAYSANRNSELT